MADRITNAALAERIAGVANVVNNKLDTLQTAIAEHQRAVTQRFRDTDDELSKMRRETQDGIKETHQGIAEMRESQQKRQTWLFRVALGVIGTLILEVLHILLKLEPGFTK